MQPLGRRGGASPSGCAAKGVAVEFKVAVLTLDPDSPMKAEEEINAALADGFRCVHVHAFITKPNIRALSCTFAKYTEGSSISAL